AARAPSNLWYTRNLQHSGPQREGANGGSPHPIPRSGGRAGVERRELQRPEGSHTGSMKVAALGGPGRGPRPGPRVFTAAFAVLPGGAWHAGGAVAEAPELGGEVG